MPDVLLDRDLVERALPAYEIGEEIGRGGWAVVLRARHRRLGREVAVKQLPRALAADPPARQRFRSEAQIIARLDHPHIVAVHDFVEVEGTCLLVMELMEPYSLWERFVAHGIALDAACALTLAAGVALAHAHDQGVLHLDVKPDNLLFSSRGVAKLSDFGIAQVLVADRPDGPARVDALIGTPAYLAPEQALAEPLTARTDIYALGVLLYELATGALPFGGGRDPVRQLDAKVSEDPRPIRDLRPGMPPALADVIMRAVAREPADRPDSATAMGEELAAAATQAFGGGWLRQCGLPVMGAPRLVGITEREPAHVAGMDPAGRAQPETTSHARIGALAPRDEIEAAVAQHVEDMGPGELAAHPSAPGDPPPARQDVEPEPGGDTATDGHGGHGAAPAEAGATMRPSAPDLRPPPDPPVSTAEPPGPRPLFADPPGASAPSRPPSSALGPAVGRRLFADPPGAAPPTHTTDTPAPARPFADPPRPAAPSHAGDPPAARPMVTGPAGDTSSSPSPPAGDPAARPAVGDWPIAGPPIGQSAPTRAPAAHRPPTGGSHAGPPATDPSADQPTRLRQPPAAAHPDEQAPPAKRRHRWAVAVLALIVIAVAAAVAGILARPLLGPADSPGTSATTVSPVPVIERFEPSPRGGVLVWRDESQPGETHAVFAYSVAGRQRFELNSRQERLSFDGNPEMCFVVISVGDESRRSAPYCINGGSAARLVTG